MSLTYRFSLLILNKIERFCRLFFTNSQSLFFWCKAAQNNQSEQNKKKGSDRMPVDMRAKPYYLDDEAVQWVEDTIASMSLEEKIGQLFFNMGSSRTEEYLKMTVDKYHIGGIRYNPGTAAEVHEQNRILQENSKIPLIIACNTENGGNGACSNGTMIGAQTKIGATGDAKYAKALGKMANTEAAAIGCNLSFAPVSDIYYNWHNPVVGLRTYGNDPQRVMEMTQAYMRARTRCPASAARPSTSPRRPG
jgi:beta-N-acetylhexosaminidase